MTAYDDREFVIGELCDVVGQLIHHLTTHGPGDDDAVERAERVLARYRPSLVTNSADRSESAFAASPADVHVARTWVGGADAMWGPRCDAGAFWSVPLISPNERAYATCLRCRSLADG